MIHRLSKSTTTAFAAMLPFSIVIDSLHGVGERGKESG